MSELVPYRLDRRENREVGRELARLEAQARMSLARVERVADVQAGRVHSVAYVGKQALHATAMLTEVEQQLGQVVPEARARLQAIADITAIGLAEIVAATNRQVGR